MNIKELQALSTVVDMLIEMSLGTKIPTDNVEQKLPDLDQAINRPPCDFCKRLDQNNEKLCYEGRDTKYCPFCGRRFKNDE